MTANHSTTRTPAEQSDDDPNYDPWADILERAGQRRRPAEKLEDGDEELMPDEGIILDALVARASPKVRELMTWIDEKLASVRAKINGDA